MRALGHFLTAIGFNLETWRTPAPECCDCSRCSRRIATGLGPELAERLEVSARTLRRDVERLRELGYPVDAARGVAGGYQLQAGAALPPLLLDDDEAVAIAVGLRAAAGGTVAGLEESAVQALTKIVSVMPPKLRRRMDALRSQTVGGPVRGPVIDAGALTKIAQACRDDERLRFGYAARSSDLARRHVEPQRLVTLDHRWYLVAYDLDRHDWRTFRLDRISEPESTRVRFRQRDLPGGDALDYVRSSRAAIPRKYDVRVKVSGGRDERGSTRHAVGRRRADRRQHLSDHHGRGLVRVADDAARGHRRRVRGGGPRGARRT